MPIKKFFLVVVLISASKLAAGQMLLSFGSIGGMKGNLVSTCPILLTGNDKCVIGASGVNAMNVSANQNGVFEASCVENKPMSDTATLSISMNMYPNPTRGFLMLRISGNYDPLLQCSIIITSIEGRKQIQQLASLSSLETGLPLNVSAFAAGSYKVTIDCAGRLYSGSFIKW